MSAQVSCIAFDKPWHPFHGIFVCHGCHRKVERAELVYYEANHESLIQEQRERMEELNKRKKNHRKNVAILKHDITITRRKRNVEFATKTENERRTKLDKIIRQSKERGDVKKSTVETRAIRTTKDHYKDRTKQKMINALMILGRSYHSRHVYNNHLISVCDAVLEREIKLGNESLVKSEKLGLMRYLKHEYLYAIEKAGYKRVEKTKQYILEDDEKSDEDIGRNLKMNGSIQELIQECVHEVYCD